MPAQLFDKQRAPLQRRYFLSLLMKVGAAGAITPLFPAYRLLGQTTQTTATNQTPVCWLDVCAPFVVEDPGAGIHSEIYLTSDTFAGRNGHQEAGFTTDYEICLYDADGNPVGSDGVAKRLTVPAMHTTFLRASDLLGDTKQFWGGMKIRLRPQSREPMYASDLFSSAFVRWKTDNSFDNVHANPDPLQWQRADSFFYSMPFPALDRYQCVFSLFNPNAQTSAGQVTLYDPFGGVIREIPYELKPHASLLLDLRRAELTGDARAAFVANRRAHHTTTSENAGARGGSLAVTNTQGTTKCFGYLLIKAANSSRFSVEHPIHQPPYKPIAAAPPLEADDTFRARNILYTPLVFIARRIGGITLQSRLHFSSGAPIEEFLWLKPFITGPTGEIVWQVTKDTPFPGSISPRQIERKAIKLRGLQSCIFECADLGLRPEFSGGMFLAVAPTTNHTLMKVELLAPEWDAHAFTHFRPGLQAERAYQKPKQRGALATDYITSGARCETTAGKITRDEIIAVINIDDQRVAGNPVLEVFGAGGLLTRINLGQVPSYACRHYLLSEVLSERIGGHDLSLRLVDESATLLMSVVHLDYLRRDLAMDHGSDRFSTFVDYPCEAVK
jgi:hypothetical protein